MNKILKKISVVMLALVLSVTLASCGSKSSIEKDVIAEFENLKKGFIELGKQLQDGDVSQIANVPQFAAVADQFKDNPEALKSLGSLSSLMSESEISVSDIKEDGDKATAKLKVKGYNFSEAMQKSATELKNEAEELQAQGKSVEEVQKTLLAKIFDLTEKNAKAEGKKDLDKAIEAQLIKVGGKWTISPFTINEISRVLSGGF